MFLLVNTQAAMPTIELDSPVITTHILFHSMVIPILTQGAEIRGHKYLKDIEKVQTELCRYYLGINSSVNNCIV